MRSYSSGLVIVLALIAIPASADKVDDAVQKGVKFLVRS